MVYPRLREGGILAQRECVSTAKAFMRLIEFCDDARPPAVRLAPDGDR